MECSNLTQNFYSRRDFAAGLAFFTCENAHDSSINLDIYGASSMPGVMASIDQYAKTGNVIPRPAQ
jgi:hypothetical protein